VGLAQKAKKIAQSSSRVPSTKAGSTVAHGAYATNMGQVPSWDIRKGCGAVSSAPSFCRSALTSTNTSDTIEAITNSVASKAPNAG
jgi:hypothetical protein